MGQPYQQPMQAPQGYGQPQYQPQYGAIGQQPQQPMQQPAQGFMGQPQYGAPMGGFMGQPQYQPQFAGSQPQGQFMGQQGGAMGQSSGASGHDAKSAEDRLHDKNQFGQQNGPDMGQMYGMVQDVLKGDADPGRIMSFLQASGGDFWKGAIAGAAAVLVVTNGAVKDALAGVVGSMFGQKAADETGAAAPETEEA